MTEEQRRASARLAREQADALREACRDESRACVRTRFCGPTNRQGSRISVMDDPPLGSPHRRMIVRCDDRLTPQENRVNAVRQWLARWIPEAEVDREGLSFAGDTFYTWRHR